MGRMCQQQTRRRSCCAARIPQCSAPLDRNLGFTDGPESLESLQGRLQDFQVSRDENGRTTITFTSRSPSFRLDYSTERSVRNGGPQERIVGQDRCGRRYTFSGASSSGEYSVRLNHNRDGSATYTFTFESGIDKACINLEQDRFFFDPDQLAEQGRPRQEYNPPVEPPPVPLPPADPRAETPITPELTPDPTRQYFPDPVAPPAEQAADPATPTPPPPATEEPAIPPGGDPFAQLGTPAPGEPSGQPPRIVQRAQLTVAAGKVLRDALAIDPVSTLATNIASRFVASLDLETLIPNGNGPEAIDERNAIVRPGAHDIRTGAGTDERFFGIPRRWGESQQAGVLIIREADLDASLESVADPSARAAIRSAYDGIVSGALPEEWQRNPNQPGIEFQLRTDGSVTVRPFAVDENPSWTASIYGPRFNNGRLVWRKVDAERSQSDGRYYASQP